MSEEGLEELDTVIDLDSEAQQTGGRLLGEGIYGCAFDTPFQCKDPKITPSIKNVAKLTKQEDARSELNATHVLESHPRATEYFILIKTVCTPSPRASQNRNKQANLKECGMLKNVPLPSMTQITMPYGGRSLFTVPYKVGSIRFFPLCQHILEAGTILLTKGIVHDDLHMNNILCDTPSSTKFIDFGNAWSPKNLTSSLINTYLTKVFDPKFLAEPPEVTYRNGIIQKKWTMGFFTKTSDLILAHIQDKKPVLDFIYVLFGISKETQIKRLKQFVQASQCVREEDWITFFSLYWTKLDAWALGAAIVFVYLNISNDPQFEHSADFKRYNQNALNTIKGLCDLDPRTRLDAVEALQLWNPESPILQEPAVKGWLKKQAEIRKLFPTL